PAVSGDFPNPITTGSYDDDLFCLGDTVDADEDLGPQECMRYRILPGLDGDHRRIDRNLPRQTERDRMCPVRDRMHPLLLLTDQVDRTSFRHPMLFLVDLGHKGLAGGLEVSKRSVLIAQVRGCGHQ